MVQRDQLLVTLFGLVVVGAILGVILVTHDDDVGRIDRVSDPIDANVRASPAERTKSTAAANPKPVPSQPSPSASDFLAFEKLLHQAAQPCDDATDKAAKMIGAATANSYARTYVALGDLARVCEESKFALLRLSSKVPRLMPGPTRDALTQAAEALAESARGKHGYMQASRTYLETQRLSAIEEAKKQMDAAGAAAMRAALLSAEARSGLNITAEAEVRR